MTKGRWISSILMASALGLAQSSASLAKGKRPSRCYAMRVGAAALPNGRNARHWSGAAFSAAEAQDLELEVLLPEALSSLPVQIKVFTPKGSLYQVLDAGEDPRSAQSKRERHRRTGRDSRSLVARFPVAGTQITTYALFGEWRAEVYVDGAETPCTRPLQFVIDP
jgi:hypothetical protein